MTNTTPQSASFNTAQSSSPTTAQGSSSNTSPTTAQSSSSNTSPTTAQSSSSNTSPTTAQGSSSNTSPTTAQSTAPKQIVDWFEIPVTDLDKASEMYAAMLDTKLSRSTFGGIPHACLSNADDSCVSGALVSDPARPPRRGSGTVIYLRASDGVASCLARASEAGAKVIQPVTDIGPHGTIAMIEDLDGNLVGLHQDPPPTEGAGR